MSNREKEVPKIMIFVLSTYERTGWYNKDIAVFLESLRTNDKYATMFVPMHNFIPVEAARNTIAQNLKDIECDWLLMIDNDMSPAPNILDCIQDAPEDAAVIVPKFFLWDETNVSLNLCWGVDNMARGHIEEKWYELNKCGTGLIFIKPEVFRKVPAPWFWRTYDELCNMQSTEDINFALKVREHGFKIYGNGKYEVGHHHSCNLSVVNRALIKAQQLGYDLAQQELQSQLESPSTDSSHDEQVSPTGYSSSAPATSPVC